MRHRREEKLAHGSIASKSALQRHPSTHRQVGMLCRQRREWAGLDPIELLVTIVERMSHSPCLCPRKRLVGC